jgi:hypothetical protein
MLSYNRRSNQFDLELLEPRVLLSADPVAPVMIDGRMSDEGLNPQDSCSIRSMSEIDSGPTDTLIYQVTNGIDDLLPQSANSIVNVTGNVNSAINSLPDDGMLVEPLDLSGDELSPTDTPCCFPDFLGLDNSETPAAETTNLDILNNSTSMVDQLTDSLLTANAPPISINSFKEVYSSSLMSDGLRVFTETEQRGMGFQPVLIQPPGGNLYFSDTNLIIDSSAILSGNGAVTGNVINAGTLSPGNSPGIIDISGDLIMVNENTPIIDDDFSGKEAFF